MRQPDRYNRQACLVLSFASYLLQSINTILRRRSFRLYTKLRVELLNKECRKNINMELGFPGKILPFYNVFCWRCTSGSRDLWFFYAKNAFFPNCFLSPLRSRLMLSMILIELWPKHGPATALYMYTIVVTHFFVCWRNR